jgi:hypothetical protein
LCERAFSGGVGLLKQIPFCEVLLVILISGYSFAGQNANDQARVAKPKPNKVTQKVKLKPLKPLSQKDIDRANKKSLEASNGKSIQKANQKFLKDQAKAIKEANKKAAKTNKSLQKANAKALRKQEKQARADTAKRKTP